MGNISADRFALALGDILEEYANTEREILDEELEKAGKSAAAKVKQNALQQFNGKTYAKSWRFDVNKERLQTLVTVYSKDRYQLAHLLENGHAKTNGGFVPGRPHVAPAQEEAEAELLQALENKL